MGFLDKLLGREPLQQQQRTAPAPTGQPYQVPSPRGGASSEDERASARYKYLLRTADPEDIERVHAEAFGKLSPEQRQMVLQRLTEDLPENERPRSDQPADLARSATRADEDPPDARTPAKCSSAATAYASYQPQTLSAGTSTEAQCSRVEIVRPKSS